VRRRRYRARIVLEAYDVWLASGKRGTLKAALADALTAHDLRVY
jgi:hypothetical protein